MMLSVMPSERYSASGSALALMKGKTARESIALVFLLRFERGVASFGLEDSACLLFTRTVSPLLRPIISVLD